MTRPKKLLIGVVALFILGACRITTAVQEFSPAVTVSSNKSEQQILQSAASLLLGGRQVLLAEDAFRYGSRIAIERRRLPETIQRKRILGRTLGQPDYLQLLITRGGRCVLLHAQSGRRTPLPKISCVPEK